MIRFLFIGFSFFLTIIYLAATAVALPHTLYLIIHSSAAPAGVAILDPWPCLACDKSLSSVSFAIVVLLLFRSQYSLTQPASDSLPTSSDSTLC